MGDEFSSLKPISTLHMQYLKRYFVKCIDLRRLNFLNLESGIHKTKSSMCTWSGLRSVNRNTKYKKEEAV